MAGPVITGDQSARVIEKTRRASEEVTAFATAAAQTTYWLIDMTMESEKKQNELRAARSRIGRVPALLRRNEKHTKMFDPVIVAIGPYHRGKPHLLDMEDHKKAAAIAFTKPNMQAFYNKVGEVVGACRGCYNDGSLPPMTDEEFIHMLFIDGCFILQFIDQFVNNDMKDFTVSGHLHGFILRDMFLLENQLPYLLLEKLMEAKSVDIDKFVDQIADTQGQWQKAEKGNSSKSIDEVHQHLLARLRARQLGPPDKISQLAWGSSWQSFRSAKELIESGIKLRRGETSFLRDVKFTPCLVWGKLSLPRIVVDDLTRSRLLNMIALEMCSAAGGDYGITSFVWFLDLLIDHADDVKELRKAEVLQNALGSDEQVAEMFNEIATDLVPDQQAYHGVMESINSYYTFKARASFYTMLHLHFGTPWAAIAFLAAVVLLLLTVVQTVFTVIQTIYTIHPPTK